MISAITPSVRRIRRAVAAGPLLRSQRAVRATCSIMGTRNASVLPEPVSDLISVSRRGSSLADASARLWCSKCGIVSCWTSVGRSCPNPLGGTPSSKLIVFALSPRPVHALVGAASPKICSLTTSIPTAGVALVSGAGADDELLVDGSGAAARRDGSYAAGRRPVVFAGESHGGGATGSGSCGGGARGAGAARGAGLLRFAGFSAVRSPRGAASGARFATFARLSWYDLRRSRRFFAFASLRAYPVAAAPPPPVPMRFSCINNSGSFNLIN